MRIQWKKRALRAEADLADAQKSIDQLAVIVTHDGTIIVYLGSGLARIRIPAEQYHKMISISDPGCAAMASPPKTVPGI